MIRRLSLLAVLAASVLAGGCAHTAVDTRLARGFDHAIDRVFVVVEVTGRWSEEDLASLEAALADALSRCLDVQYAVITPLTLDPTQPGQQREAFAPHYVLTLRQTATKFQRRLLLFAGQYGLVFEASLIETLFDTVVWRAVLETDGLSTSRSDHARSLVRGLVAALRDDGLVDCE